MTTYRQKLPQLGAKKCITDGGLETILVFKHGIDLPHFAAYDLLRTQQGYETLYAYYEQFAALARANSVGLVLETATWRANTDWGAAIGDDEEALGQFNSRAVSLVDKVRQEFDSEETPIVVSGNIGPRGDGYVPGAAMQVQEAQQYHSSQVNTFKQTAVDMVSALTLNYSAEAIGIALAAESAGLPCCISFTVETDGQLPNGESLQAAIAAVDDYPGTNVAYYMINCAHPTHFQRLFDADEPWMKRVKAIRANASCLSHAELDVAETLDDGNPEEFGEQLVHISNLAPHVTVLGGCCGTDERHIEHICAQWDARG